MGNSKIDERGRISIPKDIREKAGLKSGSKLQLTAAKEKIIIENAVTLDRFIEELKGCITVLGNFSCCMQWPIEYQCQCREAFSMMIMKA